MRTGKAVLWALGVTVVSAALLTLVKGIPTVNQLVGGSLSMFGLALFVLKTIKIEN